MTSSIIRDFEFVANRCFRDVTLTGTAPYITINAEWDRVIQQNGNSLYYNITTGATPVSTAPTATGTFVGCEITVEQKLLCDIVSPTVTTTFLRVYVYDASTGALLFKNDFLEDSNTPYVVSAEANVDTCGKEASTVFTANAVLGTNAAPATIPVGTRSFNITNLGLNGEGIVFSPLTVSGIIGTATIPAIVDSVEYSVLEDQDAFGTTPVVVTPAAGHQVWVQWVI